MVKFLPLKANTIGDLYTISNSLPAFHLPKVNLEIIGQSASDAFTTAILAAIEIGMVLACLLFIKRMSEETHIDSWTYVDDDTPDINENLKKLPLQIRVYEITGPLFFGAADAIEHIIVKDFTKCLVIRMRSVPALDFRPNISAALNRAEEIITIS